MSEHLKATNPDNIARVLSNVGERLSHVNANFTKTIHTLHDHHAPADQLEHLQSIADQAQAILDATVKLNEFMGQLAYYRRPAKPAAKFAG